MSYYEFTIQIYDEQELAEQAHDIIEEFMKDVGIRYGLSVLWKINREVVRTE